jgi:hypothetical protein
MAKALGIEVSLKDLLQRQKTQILNEWSKRMLEAPADGTSMFLKKKQDRFANPVSHAFHEAMEAIYQALVDDGEVDRGILEYAIKIKAVQGQDSFKGIAFIHQLKDILRKMPDGPMAKNELADLESRIDRIASIASEMFIANRAIIAALAEKPEGSKPRNPVA